MQVKLYKDFMYDDDFVITALERSMEELKKSKLDHPGPPKSEELPTREFGVFIEPSFQQIVGIRAETFSDKEKEMNQVVALTSQAARENNRESQLSVADSVGLTGTDIDTVSGCGSELSVNSSSVSASTENSVYICTRL